MKIWLQTSVLRKQDGRNFYGHWPSEKKVPKILMTIKIKAINNCLKIWLQTSGHWPGCT